MGTRITTLEILLNTQDYPSVGIADKDMMYSQRYFRQTIYLYNILESRPGSVGCLVW
jgi:hypothetical protein